MNQVRQIQQVIEPQVVMEGAGVRLRRSIAGRALDYLDPFLLFDHFGSDNPADYLPGFPMHPHRGIETGDVHARRKSDAPRQPGQRRHDRRGRRAVDDLGAGHHARGDAAAGERENGRLPALGQLAGQAENDPATSTRNIWPRRSRKRDRRMA